MSDPLAPGDLCVIIAPSEWLPVDARRFIGCTVVLFRECSLGTSRCGELAPFWHVSGLPPGYVVSHKALRKIPPDEMIDARSHLEPVEDKSACPESI